MPHHIITAELVRERQDDLLRSAEEYRRSRQAHPASAARPPLTLWGRARRRLGLVLLAAGTRLTSQPEGPSP